MPSVVASLPLAWRDAAGLAPALGLPWRDATLITSLGSAFDVPAPPPGSTPTTPSTAPGFVFDFAAARHIEHAVVVTDLRDDSPVLLDSLTIATDADSIVWTLSASARGDDLFAQLTGGDEQAALSVVIDGYEWQFLVEDVQRSSAFNSTTLQITGRSQTVIAGTPYQYATNWINDGPTTAAQIADQAQLFTGLELEWHLDDWLVPDKVWSLTGTPLEVLKNVADSVGAIVQSDPVDLRVKVSPRYPTLPNAWGYGAPDIEIHLSAAFTTGFQRADQPSYDGVYVSGQQQGVTVWAYLAWTTGARLAPMVTEVLCTEQVAGVQRGMAILGGMGPQARVTQSLPFLPEFGPVPLTSIVRVVEGAAPWSGMVRAVSIAVDLPTVRQQITIERHLGDIFGDEAVIKLPPAPAPAPVPVPPPPPPPPPPAGPLFHDPFVGTDNNVAGHSSPTPLAGGGGTWHNVGMADDVAVFSYATGTSNTYGTPGGISGYGNNKLAQIGQPGGGATDYRIAALIGAGVTVPGDLSVLFGAVVAGGYPAYRLVLQASPDNSQWKIVVLTADFALVSSSIYIPFVGFGTFTVDIDVVDGNHITISTGSVSATLALTGSTPSARLDAIGLQMGETRGAVVLDLLATAPSGG